MRHAVANVLARAWRNIRADFGSNIGTMLAVGLAASIPLIFSLIALNLSILVDSFMGQVEVVAYLSEDAGEQQVTQALAQVRQMPEVESAVIIDSSEALRRFAEELPEMAELVRELADNPLPPSMEIKLHAHYRDLPVMETFAQQVANLPGVVEVDYGRQWAERLGRIIGYLWIGTLIMGLFLASAAGLLVAHTIRLAIYRRREEIGIYRLVGASNSFIRLPLLVEGVVQGILGAAVGLLLSFGVYHLARWRLQSGGTLRDWLLGGIDPVWFAPEWWAVTLVIGAIIGFIAAMLSTGRYMRI